MDSKQVDQVISRVTDFIRVFGLEPEVREQEFGQIALELYDLHRKYNPVYSKYDIGELDDWRRIPLMPISEFKNNDVGLVISDRMPFPGVEFHSSGTTQRDKSKHRMYDTETYRVSIARAFDMMVTEKGPLPQFRVVLLSPSLPHSSLYYMMSYVAELYDYRGVREQFFQFDDRTKVEQLLDGLREEENPVILFGTSLAFYDFMESVSGLESLTLPEGSILIETGGWKGRDISLTPTQLTSKTGEFFGLNGWNLIREYSMSEISSQLYTWDNKEVPNYYAPHWLNYRLVDPLTQTEVPHGESGIIGFVDLANVWSCPFILTEDMGLDYTGSMGIDTLVLQGRAVNAPEKGCSLTYAQAQAMDS